jgi:plasmid maintenance system antidote protein VapI
VGFNHHIIRTYCFNHQISVSEFAKLVGKSKTHIFNIIWGKSKTSDKLALKIEEVTNGEIKASELTKSKYRGINKWDI